jgi:hypothetical protein
MLTFCRSAPLVCCLGVLAGCAFGPLPPQQSAKTIWTPRAMTPTAPSVVQKPVAPPNPWKPDANSADRDWRHIVIHHTASSGGSVPAIHEAHLGRGWDGIGYHFVIGNGSGMGDGEIEPTFRWREQMHGAHAGKTEYNQHGIGICLVGNFQETHPSEAQLASVKRLVATLKHEYQVPSENVIAHRDVKATACPGKNFPLAEVGSSHLVPLYSGIGKSGKGNPAFEVASESFPTPAAGIQLVRAQDVQNRVDTAEGRPVR